MLAMKEKQMFEEAYNLLEKHYNDKDFEQLTKEFVDINNKFRGSGLWKNLVLAVLDHLEAKAKYERSKANEEGVHKS